MPRTLDPFRLLLIAVAVWMNHEQQQIIDYLREENRVLRAQVGFVACGLTMNSGAVWSSGLMC
jgi:erythromycin esterase-like protein